MINAGELRLGNILLQKINTRIAPVRCNYQHFQLLEQGGKDLFPAVLNESWFKKAGFEENKKYALLPEAHEYILTLPVQGAGQTEIRAWIKNNKECFARAIINNIPVSNNLFQLHQLQNLYFALTGTELTVQL